MPVNTQENSSILSVQEQTVCKQIAAKGEAPHSQRAQALLALNGGASQAEAGEQSGLTEAQVRHWQGRFRTRRLSIFPDDVLASAPARPEPSAAVKKSPQPEAKPAAAEKPPAVKQSETKPAKPAEKEAPVEDKLESTEKPDEEPITEEKAEKKEKKTVAKAKTKKAKAAKKDKKAKGKKKKKAKKDKAKAKVKKKKEKGKKAKAAKKSKKSKK